MSLRKELKWYGLYFENTDNCCLKLYSWLGIILTVYYLILQGIFLCIKRDSLTEKMLSIPFSYYKAARWHILASVFGVYVIAVHVRAAFLWTRSGYLKEMITYVDNCDSISHDVRVQDRLNRAKMRIMKIMRIATRVDILVCCATMTSEQMSHEPWNVKVRLILPLALNYVLTLYMMTGLWGYLMVFYVQNYYTWLTISLIKERMVKVLQCQAKQQRPEMVSNLVSHTIDALKRQSSFNCFAKPLSGTSCGSYAMVCVLLLYALVKADIGRETQVSVSMILFLYIVFGITGLFIPSVVTSWEISNTLVLWYSILQLRLPFLLKLKVKKLVKRLEAKDYGLSVYSIFRFTTWAYVKTLLEMGSWFLLLLLSS